MILTDPLPTDPNGAKFCQIFSYPWKAIESDANGAAKANWRTIKNYPMRPRSLWRKYLASDCLVGVRFGKVTSYGMIDVDRGSLYCSTTGIARINAALETIGIVRTIPIRSSASGGIHLYIPLPDPVNSFELATSLKYCLEAAGLELHAGQLETFPNVKRWSNWLAGEFSEFNAHRLPLQPGSGGCMLSPDLAPIAGSVERFLWAWEFAARAQDLALLAPALKFGRDRHRKRKKRRDHPVSSWFEDLQTTIDQGFSAAGQTNSLLKDIGCLGRVFLRLAGEELVKYISETVQALPGYSEFCHHQNDIGARSRNWASACEGYYWPMGAAPVREKRENRYNESQAIDAQQRIATVVRQLTVDGLLADKAGKRMAQIVALAKTSGMTLYRYRELWHPSETAVNPATACDPRLLQLDILNIDEPAPPLSDKGLQTAPPLMKGVQMTAPPKSATPGGERGSKEGENPITASDPPPDLWKTPIL